MHAQRVQSPLPQLWVEDRERTEARIRSIVPGDEAAFVGSAPRGIPLARPRDLDFVTG